ncbi:MAG: tetratricopeptide repeat protein [Sulfurimonas sp.]|nr:tetratricopeptide repeat protein [Sulfurimonas sp.]
MKIFIIFLFTISICLQASQVDVEQNIETNYTKGMEYYKSNDFKNSYQLFKKIYLKKLSDIKFNFCFGRSAYESGHYETALGAFERVEMQDGSNLRNKLEMARTYYMLKMYEDSQNAYLEVLANPDIPKNIRTNIELALSRVSKVQKRSFTYATVMADVIYDSNVNYGSLGDYEFGGSNFGKIKELDSTALQIYANVTNIYDIGKKNGFAVKNSFSFYLKDYNEYNAYDIIYLTYNPSLLYKVTKYTMELVLGVDTLELDKKKYLSTASVMPKFEYNHSPTLRSITHFKYQHKKFSREAQQNLDARRLEASYGLQDILTPRSFLQGNIFIINEHKLRGSNIYVNFNEYKINTSYANQFTSTYSFDAYAELRNRKYKDYSSGFSSIRSDFGGTANFGLTMKLMPTLRLKLGTSFEYIESNQERFSYKKYTASAGIIKTF